MGSDGEDQDAAGNGLLSRRNLLGAPAFVAAGALSSVAGAAELKVPIWSTEPGAWFEPYGQPSKFEANVARSLPRDTLGGFGPGSTRTPLQHLEGAITPNGLHFERSHDGVPAIDPDRHRLLIHGLVKRPLTFTLQALARYPVISRTVFIECAGNSGALYAKTAANGTAQSLHGLVSGAEWTGVPLRFLLEETGIDPRAKWLLAEGADAASMSRSVPLAKALDDAILALYQNGERIRPANGYPMRLLLPGYEGNMQVKWLRRLKLTERRP
jgi:sulfane dehydrogenase subunit SoxC